jgi:hypothetical protein
MTSFPLDIALQQAMKTAHERQKEVELSEKLNFMVYDRRMLMTLI